MDGWIYFQGKVFENKFRYIKITSILHLVITYVKKKAFSVHRLTSSSHGKESATASFIFHLPPVSHTYIISSTLWCVNIFIGDYI